MNYQISYTANPNAEDTEVFNRGIIAEHKRKKDMKPLDFFAFFVKDESGTILGGCSGDNMYGGLFVGSLWVTEKLRNKGIGTQLMQKAETLAIESGCRFITINTFEWEALTFYKKLGFHVEFIRKGYDKDSNFCFLRKDLNKLNILEKSEFQIRLIESTLAENICRDITHNLPDYFGIPEANERYAIGMHGKISFAAFDKEKSIGLLTLELPFENNANIFWMAVKKEFQGKGIGTSLIEKAKKSCREQGLSSLTVETLSPKQNDQNYLKTYQFYEKSGFKPLFELNTYGTDFLMVYMQILI